MQRSVFKILTQSQWHDARVNGRFDGSRDDIRDGFIHLSTAKQVRATVVRHFSGESDLVMLAIDPARLGADLCWEPSRDGDQFPHLYGSLQLCDATDSFLLPIGPDGAHEFPGNIP